MQALKLERTTRLERMRRERNAVSLTERPDGQIRRQDPGYLYTGSSQIRLDRLCHVEEITTRNESASKPCLAQANESAQTQCAPSACLLPPTVLAEHSGRQWMDVVVKSPWSDQGLVRVVLRIRRTGTLMVRLPILNARQGASMSIRSKDTEHPHTYPRSSKACGALMIDAEHARPAGTAVGQPKQWSRRFRAADHSQSMQSVIAETGDTGPWVYRDMTRSGTLYA